LSENAYWLLEIEARRRTMKDRKIRVITLGVVLSLLGTPVLSLAKAGSGYRGGRGFSQGSAVSSSSVGSRGSRTFEQNGFKPIERSAASPAPAPATPHAAGPGVSPNSATPPVTQPSFLQRNPILSGFAAGLAGSWIGHMLFGATNSPAATQEGAGNPLSHEDGSSSGPSAGLLFIVMAMVAVGVYYLYKKRNGALSPVFPGFGSTSPAPRSGSPAWVPASVGILSPSLSESEPKLTAADEEEFRRLLIAIQTAWGRQDVQSLRRVATPEMSQYFSDKLAENLSAGVENRVEDVVVIRTEVREAWAEDARLYATVLMQWKAQDYVQSPGKQSSDAVDIGKGEDQALVEFVEAWIFVKHREGKWLLSAIQQIG
jgi:predicted lipid-binding transport protein (Tim44 family)